MTSTPSPKPQAVRQGLPTASVTAGPSRAARQVAAVLLEVLAGARTASAAAEALGISLMRYYQIETRALRGLVQACETQPRGRVASAEGQLAALRKEHEQLRRELARQQSLTRLAHRALGLAPPPAVPAARSTGKGRKQRRPVARALKMARQLQAADNDHDPGDTTTPVAPPT